MDYLGYRLKPKFWRAADYWRKTLIPYGKWTCADGREVLFNRWYVCIWQRYPDRPPQPADPFEWVVFTGEEWFYHDGTPDKRAAGVAILAAWGLPAPRYPRGTWGHYPKGYNPLYSEARHFKRLGRLPGCAARGSRLAGPAQGFEDRGQAAHIVGAEAFGDEPEAAGNIDHVIVSGFT